MNGGSRADKMMYSWLQIGQRGSTAELNLLLKCVLIIWIIGVAQKKSGIHTPAVVFDREIFCDPCSSRISECHQLIQT